MVTAGATRSGRKVLDLSALERDLPQLRSRYQDASPFPHIVLDGFLEEDAAREAIGEVAELSTGDWMHYVHVNERKLGNTDPSTWGPTLQEVLAELQSSRFVSFLSELTGIDDLLIDDSLEGGGIHQSQAGGYLNIHADFTVHPHHRKWRRRVNLLLYLNEDWRPEYGGDLELWSTDMARCEEKVAPVGNRVVVFTTDADSFHGHPEPLKCPEGMARRSLALYYFTAEDDPFVRSTEYRARPGDPKKRAALIFLDKQVLRAYDAVKRRIGLNDRTSSNLLGRLETLRAVFRK